MKKHMMTMMNLLHAQVCSEGNYNEALEWLRVSNPAGTSNNWQKDERPKVAPIKCEKHTERKHYLFVC